MEIAATSGILYIVGTPIGNLEDISFRAVRTLQSVEVIAAEDTRHTGKLLHHFQIQTPQISYHEHNRNQRIGQLLEMLQQGKDVALVSDAGMPGISDPGYELVKACLEAEIQVIPIPGPTAAITALCASGLPSDQFVFEGFLPAKGKDRSTRLERLQPESRPMIFYEAPHRLCATLQDFIAIFGQSRPVVIARELTKIHEQFWRGTLEEALAHWNALPQLKGEFTLIIAGISESQTPLSEEILIKELQALLDEGLSRSEASRYLAQQLSLPRRQLYQLALKL